MRDAVLRAHPWNCAIARATLAPLAEPTASDGARRFPLPADCLRTLEADAGFWAVEDGRVRAPGDRLDIVYIRRVDAAESFDALLAETLASRLAAELAYPLVNSTTLAESLWRLYEQRLREARSVDAREGGCATVADDDFWRAARL